MYSGWNNTISNNKSLDNLDFTYLFNDFSSFGTNHLRKDVLSILPCLDSVENCYQPIVEYGDIFWFSGFQKNMMNDPYSAYTVLLMCLRDYRLEVKAKVNKIKVKSDRCFSRLILEYNILYSKVLNNCVGDTGRDAKVQDLISIAAMYFVLIRTSDISNGFLTDQKNYLENGWNGKVFFGYNESLDQVAFKLSKCFFSGLAWDSFFRKFLVQSSSKDLWILKLPELEEQPIYLEVSETKVIERSYISTEDYQYALSSFIKGLTAKGIRFVIFTPLTDDQFGEFFNPWNFKKVAEDIYVNKFFELKKLSPYLKSGVLDERRNVYCLRNYTDMNYEECKNTEIEYCHISYENQIVDE